MALAGKYDSVARSKRLEKHPRYASSLNRVGVLYTECGELARAEKPFNKAHAICRQALGPNHPATVQTRRNLALLYRTALNTPAPRPAVLSYVGKPGTLPPAAYFWEPSSSDLVESVGEGSGVVPVDEAVSVSAKVIEANPYAPAAAPKGYYSKSTAPGKESRAIPPPAPAQLSAWLLHERIISQPPAQVKSAIVPVLVAALREASKPEERAAFARALGELGPAAGTALPALTRCLKNAKAPAERRAILLALGQLGPAARSAVPLMLAALRSDCVESCRCAAAALVNLGPVARTALGKQMAARGEKGLVQEVFTRLQGQDGRIGIADAGECFSTRVLRLSLRDIHSLARKDKLEVMIETVPALDSGAQQRVTRRVSEMGARGVYVLVARDGSAARVEVGAGLRRQGLTPEKVTACVQPRFRNKEYDRALVKTVRLIADSQKKPAK
jgi:hypothetical protein